MKYVWEPHDIRAGRRVLSNNRSEIYIIGYDPRTHGKAQPAFLLFSLADGMLVELNQTATDMANGLNRDNNIPEKIEPDIPDI